MALRDFPPIRYVGSREDFLVESASGKRVLHIGCADAIHMEEHAAIGRLLHPRIEKVAAASLGLDVDAEAISRLRKYCSGPLAVGDAENLNSSDFGGFDLIIAGEVIEHLENPGLFLSGLGRHMTAQTELIITTPNLLGLKTMLFALSGVQRIHHDHTVGFTFSLLQTLAERRGFRAIEWVTAPESFGSRRNLIANRVFGLLYSICPRFGDSVCVRLAPVENR